jgi:hypothetical protein
VGSTHFTDVTGGLEIGTAVDVEPTGGLGVPPSGGSFILAARTKPDEEGLIPTGVWAKWTNQVGLDPAPKGGAVVALLRSGAPAGIFGAPAGARPFIFGCAEPAPYDIGAPPDPLPAPTIQSVAYMAGLVLEEGGARVVLVKGKLVDGLPGATPAAPGQAGVLARGDELIDPATWVHLRLVAIWNTTGDVMLRVERNEVSPLTPTWVPITPTIIDDVLGARTGSPGLPAVDEGVGGGFFGLGAHHVEPLSIACFDLFAAERQV